MTYAFPVWAPVTNANRYVPRDHVYARMPFPCGHPWHMQTAVFHVTACRYQDARLREGGGGGGGDASCGRVGGNRWYRLQVPCGPVRARGLWRDGSGRGLACGVPGGLLSSGMLCACMPASVSCLQGSVGASYASQCTCCHRLGRFELFKFVWAALDCVYRCAAAHKRSVPLHSLVTCSVSFGHI